MQAAGKAEREGRFATDVAGASKKKEEAGGVVELPAPSIL